MIHVSSDNKYVDGTYIFPYLLLGYQELYLQIIIGIFNSTLSIGYFDDVKENT